MHIGRFATKSEIPVKMLLETTDCLKRVGLTNRTKDFGIKLGLYWAQ